ISNGGFKEGNRAILALIGQNLHERDPRGIVDADMDELPTDAAVTVDCARVSPSDAVPHRADPAKLFDIEVDELAWSLAFITPDRFGRLQGTEFIQSQPTQNPLTVASETPLSAAICLPVQRCRRSRS